MVRVAMQAGGGKPAKPVKLEKDPIIGFLETKCGCVPQKPSAPTCSPRSRSALDAAAVHSLLPHCATCAPQG
jgi:hypothetical protein